MATEGFKHNLADILSADIEAYNSFINDDNGANDRSLTFYRTEIEDLVQQFRGRIVDTPGDKIARAVEAANCALEIQRDFAKRNT